MLAHVPIAAAIFGVFHKIYPDRKVRFMEPRIRRLDTDPVEPRRWWQRSSLDERLDERLDVRKKRELHALSPDEHLWHVDLVFPYSGKVDLTAADFSEPLRVRFTAPFRLLEADLKHVFRPRDDRADVNLATVSMERGVELRPKHLKPGESLRLRLLLAGPDERPTPGITGRLKNGEGPMLAHETYASKCVQAGLIGLPASFMAALALLRYFAPDYIRPLPGVAILLVVLTIQLLVLAYFATMFGWVSGIVDKKLRRRLRDARLAVMAEASQTAMDTIRPRLGDSLCASRPSSQHDDACDAPRGHAR